MSVPIHDAAALAAHQGEVVELVGRYDIWDLGPHRVMVELPDGRSRPVRKVVNLELDDQSVVRLWVRPAEEMTRLEGQRVIARGRLYIEKAAPPHMASPSPAPSLLDIERIEPA
jgi:hypothetical protein